jgi:hypothetical protein
MSTQQPDEETALEVRAPQIRSLAWLRPTGQFYSNPAHIHRARKRRHARVPPDTFKRTSYTSRGGVGSPRASELRSPPRQHAKSKHSRGSPKAARRPVTTDRRQRAAAAAFVLGTPCENCGHAMQRCFGSGRFCGQTCASKFSRVGRAATSPRSEPGSVKKADSDRAPPGRPCEACGSPVMTVFGSGRFCKKACAARFSRIGSKNRTNADVAVPAPESGSFSPGESTSKHVLQDRAEMEVERVHSPSATVSLAAETAITASASDQLMPAEM